MLPKAGGRGGSTIQEMRGRTTGYKMPSSQKNGPRHQPDVNVQGSALTAEPFQPDRSGREGVVAFSCVPLSNPAGLQLRHR